MKAEAPESMDEVLARAARLSRSEHEEQALPRPSVASLELSLASVARHARDAAIAQADKAADPRGVQSAPAAAEAASADKVAPRSSMTEPFAPVIKDAADPEFAAVFGRRSEVFAASQHDVAASSASALDSAPADAAMPASTVDADQPVQVDQQPLMADPAPVEDTVRTARLRLGAMRRPRAAFVGLTAVVVSFAVIGIFRSGHKDLDPATANGVASSRLANGRSIAVGGPADRIATAAVAPRPTVMAPAAPAAPAAASAAIAALAASAAAVPRALPAANEPPPPPLPVAAAPAFEIVAERGDAGNAALAEQLLGRSLPKRPTELGDVWADGWLASLAALATQPRMAVVRYDALQAARRAPASSRLPALQVVAPLALEPMYVVVRNDSPLQYMHQIQGKAINAGAPQSSRALTVGTLYRSLFDKPLPVHALSGQDEAAALESLAAGKLDVVVLVGSAAGPWFANVLAATGGAFKLLAFDATQPLAQKALGSFLPMQAELRSLGAFPTARTPTLGVMSFVVTARPPRGDSADHDRAVAGLAEELCSARSGLRRAAPPLRSRVDPTLQLDVGWPYSATAQAALARCAVAGTAAARSGASPPGSS